jgi:hypothetical protein
VGGGARGSPAPRGAHGGGDRCAGATCLAGERPARDVLDVVTRGATPAGAAGAPQPLTAAAAAAAAPTPAQVAVVAAAHGHFRAASGATGAAPLEGRGGGAGEPAPAHVPALADLYLAAMDASELLQQVRAIVACRTHRIDIVGLAAAVAGARDARARPRHSQYVYRLLISDTQARPSFRRDPLFPRHACLCILNYGK